MVKKCRLTMSYSHESNSISSLMYSRIHLWEENKSPLKSCFVHRSILSFSLLLLVDLTETFSLHVCVQFTCVFSLCVYIAFYIMIIAVINLGLLWKGEDRDQNINQKQNQQFILFDSDFEPLEQISSMQNGHYAKCHCPVERERWTSTPVSSLLQSSWPQSCPFLSIPDDDQHHYSMLPSPCFSVRMLFPL